MWWGFHGITKSVTEKTLMVKSLNEEMWNDRDLVQRDLVVLGVQNLEWDL